MKRIIPVVALLCATHATHASAQSADSVARAPLTLEAAIASARRQNADLRVARALVDSARAELRIARAIPNPVVSGIPNSPYQYSATLPLDVGPQRWRRSAVASLGVDASRADARDTERQLTASVARAFFDVLLADARMRITSGRRDVMRQLVAADSIRVRAGDIPARALFRSQVELVRADADLARSQNDGRVTRMTLQGLMGIDHPDPTLPLAGTLNMAEADAGPVDSAVERVVERRPDVVAARVREAQAHAAQKLASVAAIPVPQLSVVRQFGAPFDNGRFTAFGLGLELPLFNQYSGQRARAAAGLAASEAARQRTLSLAEREIATSRNDYLAQRALVQRYESGVINDVQQHVDATRYAYARGAASLLEVLDALRTQQDVLGEYYTTLHDYWTSVFTYRAATAALGQ